MLPSLGVVWRLVLCAVFEVAGNGVSGLKMVSLEVPQLVASGQETTLTCVFDLQSDTLYSLKWYRDDLEFFRYVPSDKPPNQFFPLQGLHIDMVRSSNGTVFIRDVEVSTAGTYKCEISAEGPSFQTVSSEKMLTVIVVNSGARLLGTLWMVSLLCLLTCQLAVC